ncbi:cobaltochelatase subunit CobN [Methanolobus sp. WCC4]|uniref:cobaltochelatase subunit CobN n=1 Tax=Methanolobus sp. WCC4 TaxID=3125784 RepID=UPI0030FA3B5A
MQNKRIMTLFISVLLLLSLTTVATAEENDYYLVANTTSDADGNFVFEDIPNGEYLLYSVNQSYSKKYDEWRWYNGMIEINVDSADINDIELQVFSSSDIDQNKVLAYLDQSSISGTTYLYAMSTYYYKVSDLVLVDKQTDELVANTTSDINGNFTFEEIPNGEYLLYSVNQSYSKKYDEWRWYNGMIEINVDSADINDIEIQVSSSSDIDQNEVLAYLDQSSISGTTYLYAMSTYYYKISDLVLVDKQTDELVANTTSDINGNFTFEDIPNGEYLLYSVNQSYSKKYDEWRWYNGMIEITVDSADINDIELQVSSSSDIDQNEVLAYLDQSSISGTTYLYAMSTYYYKVSDLVLLKQKGTVEVSNAPHLNVSIITGYSSYKEELANFTQRINSNPDYNITVSYYITDNIPEDLDLNNTDIIYSIMVASESASKFEEQVQNAIDNGALVIGDNTELPESNYTIPSDCDDKEDFKADLYEYWSGTAIDDTNLDNLIFYLAKEYYGRDDLTVESAVYVPAAIYHPAITDRVPEYMMLDAGEYFEWYANRTDGHAFDENAPTVAITFYRSYYLDDIDSIDKLIDSFEDKGTNVIACYGDKNTDIDSFLNYSEETKVDVVVSFNFLGNYFDMEELDVPVMSAVLNTAMNISEWESSNVPLPAANMNRLYRPEGEAVIDLIMIGALETIQVANTTTEAYIAVDEQVDWLTDRAIAQANLGLENESDKKVVIIYYNHGGGKDNIGASYLEAMPSIVNLLEGMETEGYDINSNLIPNKTELVDLIVHQGRNIGTWAPGELETMVETGEVELIPESIYLSWFYELPEERRDEVTEMWGEAPGEIMVYTDENEDRFIVIPKISISDNVILAPQPTRGWLQDKEVLYHDTELPPHHQYIAFYLWLQHEFDADVMVNMGRHGTVEWLPGKEFGLLAEEWPAIMTGDIPVIYPYVMDGLGEGLQAKRRGNAVMIDHLIPPVVSAGLYGDYATLSSEITSYRTSVAEDEYKQVHFYEIVNLTIELGLDDKVNMSLAESNETIDSFLEEVDDVLTDLKSLSMPYGLHVLGEAPEGEELVGMVNSMMGDDFSELIETYNASDNASNDLLTLVLLENMSTTEAQIQILGTSTAEIGEELNTSISYAELLGEADNEVQQVLNAMDGEYIEGNLGGDPVQKPETLPSGRNFYSFDEDLIPSKAAWDNAVELIDVWLAEYYAENGEYPTKVGYILWAGETTRHEGVMESQILYLMGIKPVWDDGEVAGLVALNSSELGRPRVDVLIQISGLYRDTFPGKIKLLDQAVRLAYEQEETADCPNYVKQNTDDLKSIYDGSIENETLSLDVAQFSIFGPAPGAYGTGMANAASTNENSTELAELYINRMCYIYGENIWGQTIGEYIRLQTGEDIEIENTVIFENALNGTDVIVHSRSSSTYGATNTDDFYQYVSGLANAIKELTGEMPEILIANLENPDDLTMEDLKTYLENELYTVFSDVNIEGWMEHGYEGSRMMMEFVENLWGIEVLTPDLVTDDMWDKVYDKFVADSEVSEWMKEVNPHAYGSITGRLIDVVRTGHWTPSDEVLEILVNEYLDTVIEHGVTCCHHTCGNPLLDEFIQSLIDSERIDVSKDKMDDYNVIMAEVRGTGSTDDDTSTQDVKTTSVSSSSSKTGTELNVVENNGGNQTTYSNTGAGDMLEEEASMRSSVEDSYVEGYEMTKETVSATTESNSPSISGSDILASVFVLALLGAIYVGFWKRRQF